MKQTIKTGEMEITFRQIGVIHSSIKKRNSAPFQGVCEPDSEGTVEVFPEYEEGLKDIGGFSHLILLYYFHKAGRATLTASPYIDPDSSRGIFAIRKPERPNPIGLSVVKLVRVEGNILCVEELDILDGTPLLDIKPLVPAFDFRKYVQIGWLEEPLRKKYPLLFQQAWCDW